jgi:phenylalanyl-tRNA synthetase beta chain
VREAGGALLSRAEVFDVYRGAQVGEGSSSLALRLEFRAPDRTLTDEEVAGLREAIKAKLDEIGGSLRE